MEKTSPKNLGTKKNEETHDLSIYEPVIFYI